VTGKWQSTVIPPRSGMAWRLTAGQRMRITDLEGSQSGDLFAVAADDVEDGQGNGRTFDMGGTIRLPAGSVLYSRRSRPLLRIVEDEAGVHDMLYAPCSQEMFELQYGVAGPHPNCFDNLAGSLAEFGGAQGDGHHRVQLLHERRHRPQRAAGDRAAGLHGGSGHDVRRRTRCARGRDVVRGSGRQRGRRAAGTR
jgi:uncharacterized protein YcgI (DUF1989 family)